MNDGGRTTCYRDLTPIERQLYDAQQAEWDKREKAMNRVTLLEALLEHIDAQCEEWLHDDKPDSFKYAYAIKLLAARRREQSGGGPSAPEGLGPTKETP